MKREKIREIYKECDKEIHEKMNETPQLLLGDGNIDADIMIVAEFVRAQEEEQGQNLLDNERLKIQKLLDSVGYSYEQVYTTHLVKYRPYRLNKEGKSVFRKAKKEEYDFFMPYLKKEIALVSPKLIITLGNKMLQQLIEDASLTVKPEEDQLFVISIHGRSYNVLPLLHPLQKQFKTELEIVIRRETDRLNQLLSGKQNKEIKENGTKDIEMTEEEKLTKKKRVFQKVKRIREDDQSQGKEKCITIIYGGEGYVDDPVLVVLERVSHVLTELGVTIHRIDLHKSQDSMETILSYMNKAIGVVLAVNVEWYGIGHRMQEFLDQCFYRGEMQVFDGCPLLGIVVSRKAHEFEAYTHLLKSWEYLGGIEGTNILASIESAAILETNFEWLFGIDKKAETFFRLIQQKRGKLPRSGKIEKLFVEIPIEGSINSQELPSELPDKEKEKKGIIENYDSYIEKQQEDIHQLGSLFKQKLSAESVKNRKSWPERFKESYINKGNIQSKIQISVEDDPRENTVLELDNQHIRAYYGQIGDSDVLIIGKKSDLRRIVDGKLTMQRAFMTGEIKAKGDFTLLYKFGDLFAL